MRNHLRFTAACAALLFATASLGSSAVGASVPQGVIPCPSSPTYSSGAFVHIGPYASQHQAEADQANTEAQDLQEAEVKAEA